MSTNSASPQPEARRVRVHTTRLACTQVTWMSIKEQSICSFTFLKVGEILIKVSDYLTCLTIEGGVANMLTDDVMMWINGGL